jgi:hypothetical protein
MRKVKIFKTNLMYTNMKALLNRGKYKEKGELSYLQKQMKIFKQ